MRRHKRRRRSTRCPSPKPVGELSLRYLGGASSFPVPPWQPDSRYHGPPPTILCHPAPTAAPPPCVSDTAVLNGSRSLAARMAACLERRAAEMLQRQQGAAAAVPPSSGQAAATDGHQLQVESCALLRCAFCEETRATAGALRFHQMQCHLPDLPTTTVQPVRLIPPAAILEGCCVCGRGFRLRFLSGARLAEEAVLICGGDGGYDGPCAVQLGEPLRWDDVPPVGIQLRDCQKTLQKFQAKPHEPWQPQLFTFPPGARLVHLGPCARRALGWPMTELLQPPQQQGQLITLIDHQPQLADLRGKDM